MDYRQDSGDAPRELHPHANATVPAVALDHDLSKGIDVPDEGDYVLFLGSGRSRPGDLDHQARNKSWSVVNVDLN